MSQDFTQFELDPHHPYPDPYDGSSLDGIDPAAPSPAPTGW